MDEEGLVADVGAGFTPARGYQSPAAWRPWRLNQPSLNQASFCYPRLNQADIPDDEAVLLASSEVLREGLRRTGGTHPKHRDRESSTEDHGDGQRRFRRFVQHAPFSVVLRATPRNSVFSSLPSPVMHLMALMAPRSSEQSRIMGLEKVRKASGLDTLISAEASD